MGEIFGPGRLANAKNLRDRDDVMWEIDKAVEAWEADRGDRDEWHAEAYRLRQRLEAAEKKASAWKLAAMDDDWSGVAALAAGESEK